MESVQATLHAKRPDLIPVASGEPIPVTKPIANSKRPARGISDISLSTSDDWPKEQDPTGWWLSENIEGTRVYWNGNGRFYMSNGLEIQVSDKLKQNLPNFALDGILRSNQNAITDV